MTYNEEAGRRLRQEAYAAAVDRAVAAYDWVPSATSSYAPRGREPLPVGHALVEWVGAPTARSFSALCGRRVAAGPVGVRVEIRCDNCLARIYRKVRS